MAIRYFIYTAGSDIYGKAEKESTPWADDAVDAVNVAGDLYTIDDANPFLYLGTALAATSSDEFIGDVRDLHYGSLTKADLFFSHRLHAFDWTNSPAADKVRALYHASMLIDKFNFIGTKVSATQLLEWPRQCVDSDGNVTTISNGQIPTPIDEAAYLIAEALLGGRDPQQDFEALMNKVETFGPIRTEFERARGPQEHLANLIPSPDAWQRIKPFLLIASGFDVNPA